MKWLIYRTNLRITEAESTRNQLLREDKKLRERGYAGNYAGVKIEPYFDGPSGKMWAVYVHPIQME